MVYIYKKTIGNKTYYYLRASERKGSKIAVKDIAYLGSTIEEVKKSIESLPKYKEKIRKAYKNLHNFIESNHYLEKISEKKLKKDIFLGESLEQIEACKLHYNSIFQKLDFNTRQEIWKNFIVDFAFNTTSVEGNTINLEEARNLLIEGLTPKDKTLREIYDLQNTEKVFLEILDLKEDLSHELIIKIHGKLMENIDPRKGYRTTDVRVLRSNFDATPAPYVKIDMGILLEWYNKNKESLHPLVFTAIFHHKFEKIHPFMDGNGRTGRMLVNYLLTKNNYPPLIMRKKSRKDYLEALRNADKSDISKSEIKDYKELIQFVSNEFIESYWNIFL